MPAKATGFLDSVTASLVSAVASSALGGSQQPQKKAKAANPSHGSTAPPSTAQPSTSEVTVSVRSPLESALQCLGGPDAVVNAQGLTLVTLTFPKPQRNRYVTGLQGNVKQTFNNTFQDQRIHLDPKDPKSLFRIRWDFDPNRSCHVNAEFFSTQLTTKIAFTKSGDQVVKTPGNQSSTEYDQTVHDYSTWLGYQTKPNTATEKNFTPQQRTGEATSANQEATLTAMASKLAQRWKRQYAPAAAQGG